MPANENDRKAGFRAQKRACEIINKLLQKNGSDKVAKETGKEEDMIDKYDIYIENGDGTRTSYMFDVKNSNLDTGNISYTVINCNGDKAISFSKETNTKGVRLIFMFGDSSSTLYFPDMEQWYKFAPTCKLRDGTTDVLKKTANGVEHLFGTRGGKRVDLYDYYNCVQVEKDYAGDIMNVYVARPTIQRRKEEVELSFNSKKQTWYFENGSKYILVPKDEIIRMSSSGTGSIKQI